MIASSPIANAEAPKGQPQTVILAGGCFWGMEDLLRVFWEHHDPTQGMRQGNDVGSQYRSAIYVADDVQAATAAASRDAYQVELTKAGYGTITTEIAPAGPFYYAEAYHQQYLSKNPRGYCPDHGTGVACPTGLGVSVGSASTAPIAFL